jgi:hypothetical protein
MLVRFGPAECGCLSKVRTVSQHINLDLQAQAGPSTVSPELLMDNFTLGIFSLQRNNGGVLLPV